MWLETISDIKKPSFDLFDPVSLIVASWQSAGVLLLVVLADNLDIAFLGVFKLRSHFLQLFPRLLQFLADTLVSGPEKLQWILYFLTYGLASLIVSVLEIEYTALSWHTEQIKSLSGPFCQVNVVFHHIEVLVVLIVPNSYVHVHMHAVVLRGRAVGWHTSAIIVANCERYAMLLHIPCGNDIS